MKCECGHEMQYIPGPWEAQLNLYSLLYRRHGFLVNRARIVAILRDWSKSRAQREPDYPQSGVVVVDVPLWSHEEQESYLDGRIMLHQQAESLADDDLPLCTEEERWMRKGKIALMAKGRKRALKLFDSAEDAQNWEPPLGYKHLTYLEHRPSRYPRCELFCDVRDFCAFGRSLKPADNLESLLTDSIAELQTIDPIDTLEKNK